MIFMSYSARSQRGLKLAKGERAAARLVSGLAIALSLSVIPAYAKPLTKAETRICEDLDQCLSIVDRHPHDSFDYSVLSSAFARFGMTGQKALLRMISGDRASAGHAADLLVMIAGAPLLPVLQAEIEAKPRHEAALLLRTQKAILTRLNAQGERADMALRTSPRLNVKPSSCRVGEAIDPGAKKRQMPFFEVDVASPDARGVVRPSAPYPLPIPRISRADLNSAVPIGTHWVAAYEGGLVFYDGASGQPTILSDLSTVSVQPWAHPDLKSDADNIWAILIDGESTVVMDATPPAPLIKAKLPGFASHIRRVANGDLLLSTDRNFTVRLRTDGKISNGCVAAPAAPRR